MNLPSILRPILATVFLLIGVGMASAHPIPDIPIRGTFEQGGACTIHAEVNPRCFEADPKDAPSLTFATFKSLPAERKEELLKQADALVRRSVEFYFEPVGRFQPEFKFDFTGEGHKPLANDDDVVVVMGIWKTTVASGLTGWKIRSTPENKLAVVFQNFINGEAHPRLNVLFPGETSFTLDLTALTGAVPSGPSAGSVNIRGSSTDTWSTFVDLLKQGFVHVLPLGVDHILFVLGLFLLSRSAKPLLLQVTTFTVAHTVTLALATLGWVHVDGAIVEPIIAASIAAVALENIFHPKYTPWRLIIVFTFGLIHGLGFAGALSDLGVPQSSLIVGLIGFNIGVEAAQLTVIAIALLVTIWIREPGRYRQWIVIPGSALIAAIGLWWAVQRVIS